MWGIVILIGGILALSRSGWFSKNTPNKQLMYHNAGSIRGQARAVPDHSDVRDRAMSINSQRPEMQSLNFGRGFQDAHRPGLLEHGAMPKGDDSGIWHVNY